VRNDNYFNFPDKGKSALLAKGQFTVKDYYVRTIVGSDAAITALNNGEVDLLDSQYHLETQPSFLATWGFNRIALYDGYGVQEIGVNMRHPVLGTGADTPLGRQDPTKAALAAKYVRQAISYAVPRDQIISDLLNGYGIPAITTPVIGNYRTKTAGTEGFNTDLQPYSFNLTKSRELLQLAGYSIASGSPGLKRGDLWSLSANVHCSLYCPFRSIANVNGIIFSVENVTATLVTLNEIYTFDNGTQPKANIIQGDLKSGVGNLGFALIAGGLGAGDTIYDSASAGGFTLNPTINATVTRAYAGALREVNVVTLPYTSNGLTETVTWDQIEGAVLEVNLSDVSYGLSDSVLIRATGTNMWAPSISADFAINSYPLSQGLIPGLQTSLLVNVTSLQGLTGHVSLFLKYPPQITAVLNTTTVTLNSGTTSYATLTVTTPRNLGAAIYVVNVTAQSGSTIHYAAITIIIKPPDFFLQPFGAGFPAGQVGSSRVLVGSLNTFNGTVNLSLTIPPGIDLTTSCNPTTVTLNATDILGGSDCTFASSTPGTYSVNITGTSGPLTHTKTFLVMVTPLPTTPDFYMSVNPNFLSIAQGSSANATITLTALNGFKGNITLTGIGELGLFETFTSRTVNLNSASATSIMTVQIRPGLGTGISYDIRIIGSNGTTFGGLVHATFIDVIVFAPPPPDYSVATNQPDVSLNSGQSGTFTLSTTGRNGFSAQVSLTTSVSPVQGLTVNCPGNVNVTGSLSTSCNLSAATPGLYLVTVTLTGGGHTHSTSITVRVGDFIMMFSAPHIVTPGSSTVSTITMMSVFGFTGTVSVSDTPLPADMTCDISPTSITVPSSSVTVTLSCTPSSAGTFTVTITASGGSLTHTVTIVVTATDFTLTSSFSSFTANAGTGGTSTITIAPQSGFTGTIDMTVTAPSGVSCSLSRTTITDSGSATLTCSSNTPGTYVVTVNGSSNGKSKSINETFTVNSQPQQTPTLLGLQPGLFYATLAGVIVFIAAIIGILVYRQRKRPEESKSSTTTT